MTKKLKLSKIGQVAEIATGGEAGDVSGVNAYLESGWSLLGVRLPEQGAQTTYVLGWPRKRGKPQHPLAAARELSNGLVQAR
jgi:hypothetical protein